MHDAPILPPGQQQARTRWGTHESGAAFDRKKVPYLSEQTQEFLAHQSFCVLAGLGAHHEIYGLLAMATPGFVRVLDRQTCLLQLDPRTGTSPIIQTLHQCQRTRRLAHLGLFFINHATRERLCVQGAAELVADGSRLFWPLFHRQQGIQLRLHVQQAFFHCSKYLRTRIAGLTVPIADSSEQDCHPQQLLGKGQHCLTEAIRTFIVQQVLCFLCTVSQQGHCAVNHRGGAPGFLVPVPPDVTAPGGFVLLPDYAGNGAFEAIGNILETKQAALVIPNYAAQVALCLAGSAGVIERGDLPMELTHRCAGAERVVALRVQHVEIQRGDWSATLAYERERAQAIITKSHSALTCPR